MPERPLLYLDHAATCGTRPPEVLEAVQRSLLECSANPGRSGHRRSLAAARVVFGARVAIARLFGVPDERHVVFAFNATDALNIAIRGLLERANGRVLTSALEHNSVMRPLRALAAQTNLRIETAPGTTECIDAAALADELQSNDVRLVAINHASNVTGAVQPVADIGRVCRDAGVPMLVDAAQSAGVLDIDVERDRIDLLAFTGHKGLHGIPGTGGLCVHPALDLEPLRRGGTGSQSEEEVHPDFYPDRLEAGTPNTPGLAALEAGVRFLEATGVESIRAHERALAEMFRARVTESSRVRVIGDSAAERVAVVSIAIDGVSPSTIAHRLDREFGVLVRAGLHCAPHAHRTLGTHPEGTTRFSFGFFDHADDVERAARAVHEIAATERSEQTT